MFSKALQDKGVFDEAQKIIDAASVEAWYYIGKQKVGVVKL